MGPKRHERPEPMLHIFCIVYNSCDAQEDDKAVERMPEVINLIYFLFPVFIYLLFVYKIDVVFDIIDL